MRELQGDYEILLRQEVHRALVGVIGPDLAGHVDLNLEVVEREDGRPAQWTELVWNVPEAKEAFLAAADLDGVTIGHAIARLAREASLNAQSLRA